MDFETMQVSAEVVNAGFLDRLDSGMIKEAEDSASAFIRQRLYEDGILRRLFTPQSVTADMLDPEVDSDKPSILVEIEPNAPKATFVPFKGTGDRGYFEGRRFRVPFGMVEAERQTKSKFELMTIRMDIMTWLKEHQVKAIQEQEDSMFMETIEDIVNANAATQAVDATAAGSFKNAFVLGLQRMAKLKQPVGRVLMPQSVYYDSLKLKTDEIGFKPQEDRFNRGVQGEDSFMGTPVVTTIKDNLWPSSMANAVYFFAPQEYFCKFYLLQDATLFLKYEGANVTFHTYEAPALGIGNTSGVVRVKF